MKLGLVPFNIELGVSQPELASLCYTLYACNAMHAVSLHGLILRLSRSHSFHVLVLAVVNFNLFPVMF